MSRVTRGPERRRPVGDRAAKSAGLASWGPAALFVGGVGIAVLALYLLHPLLAGYRLPLGPDGPVYAWWTAAAEAEGLDAIRRPGVPGAMLALGGALRADPLETAAILGPLLASVLALAAVSVAESALGPDRWRSALAGVLVGAFAAALAPGWLANLAMAALFAGAISLLAHAGPSPRPVAGAAALLVAGGLAHWQFLLIGAGILLGAAAVLRVRGRAGAPEEGPAPGRIAAAAVAGPGLAALGLLPVWLGDPVAGDTSQDQFFRRAGDDFREFLRTRFRERLAADLRRYGAALGVSALLAALARGGPARGRPGGRYLGALGAVWAIATVAGVAFLAVSGLGPGGRLLAFAFFLPFAAALGARRAMSRGSLRWLAAAGALVLVIASMWSWYRQRPYVREDELAVAHTAAAAVAATPEGTPLVFLVDTDQQAAAFHVARYGNVIRAALPPERIEDARLVVGTAGDLLAGRPSENGDIEHDRLSELYLEEARSALDEAVILALEPFAGEGYEEAVSLGEPVADGVVQLAGPELTPAAAPPGRPGLSGAGLVARSLGALMLLWVLGLGWARWGLPHAAPGAVLAIAPSAGLAVVIIGAYAADRLGLGAAAWGGAAAAVLGAAGFVATPRPRQGAVERPEDG